ncbi:MAG: roadblock/LC7 domain-containing protein [Candidatus Hodarchaeota archaeon]
MDINNAVNDLLVKFIRSTPGIKQILLSDATGLIISKAAKEDGKFSDFEGFAAISTALYLGMSELKLGKLGFSLSEFPDSNLCFYGVTNEHVLVVITFKNASIKKLKTSLKAISTEISQQLDLWKTAEKIESKQEEIIEKSVGLSKEEFDQLLDELSF